MKKKLLIFIIAFAVIMTGGIFLTACGGGGKTPTLSTVKIEYQGQESNYFTLSEEYELGQYPTGYNVKAYYSDGAANELTTADYTVSYQYPDSSTHETLETNTTGCYSIKITYNNFEATLSFVVVKAKATYTLNVSNRSWRYKQLTNGPTLTVTANGGAAINEGITYYYVQTTADATAPTESELENKQFYYFHSYGDDGSVSLKAEELTPGTYFLFAEVSDQETTQGGTTDYVKVNVAKGLVMIPQAVKTSLAEYTYNYNNYSFDGTTQTLAGMADEINVGGNIKGTVMGGSSEDEVTVHVEPVSPDEKLTLAINNNSQQFKFVSADPCYEVQNPDFSMNITVIRQKIKTPTISYDSQSSTISSIVLNLAECTEFSLGAFRVEKRVGGEGNLFEDHNIDLSTLDDGQRLVKLDTLTAAGEYYYRILLKYDVCEWDYGDADTTGLNLAGYLTLTWDIADYNMESREWGAYNKNGIYILEDNGVITKYGNDVFQPYIWEIPINFIYSHNYKFYDAENNQEISTPTEVGNYYAVYEKSNITQTNGHYVVTGDRSIIHYSITDGDVTGKRFVFADLKLIHADDGTEVAEGEEGLENWIQMTKDMRASNLGIDAETGEPLPGGSKATANCETNGTVSGTCDFGGGTFDELLNSEEEQFRYEYWPYQDNTVEMYQGVDAEQASLVGNLFGNTLTLTMSPETGLTWVFTFTLAETD